MLQITRQPKFNAAFGPLRMRFKRGCQCLDDLFFYVAIRLFGRLLLTKEWIGHAHQIIEGDYQEWHEMATASTRVLELRSGRSGDFMQRKL